MEIKMKCVVVDDEPFALKLMEEEIKKVSFLDLKAMCSSTDEAKARIATGVDLLFLDIQMPKITGLQFLRTLQNPPLVIITTAFQEHAFEGFELDVVDYLLKPILFERFLKAVNKARQIFESRSLSKPDNSFFFIHSNYKEIKIFSNDVLYIEGLKDYVKIFLASQTKAILTRQNLKSMEGILPKETFIRLHNSFIVNVKKITGFQKSQVFIEKTVIPIGDKFASAFEEFYKVSR